MVWFLCGSVVGEIRSCPNNPFGGYRQDQQVKVMLEVVCMVPFVFVKLEGSYIFCHLLNYWVQCNAVKECGGSLIKTIEISMWIRLEYTLQK